MADTCTDSCKRFTQKLIVGKCSRNYFKGTHTELKHNCPVTSSGNRTQTSHNLWFQVQHYPFYTNLTFACKTETSGSLYSHALLILLKSSKSKYQVVHEHKFKDLPSSTCQVSVERIVLDLESEVTRGPGSIPTRGNILSLDFFHVVKPLMPIFPLLSSLSIFEKLECLNNKADQLWRV